MIDTGHTFTQQVQTVAAECDKADAYYLRYGQPSKDTHGIAAVGCIAKDFDDSSYHAIRKQVGEEKLTVGFFLPFQQQQVYGDRRCPQNHVNLRGMHGEGLPLVYFHHKQTCLRLKGVAWIREVNGPWDACDGAPTTTGDEAPYSGDALAQGDTGVAASNIPNSETPLIDEYKYIARMPPASPP